LLRASSEISPVAGKLSLAAAAKNGAEKLRLTDIGRDEIHQLNLMERPLIGSIQTGIDGRSDLFCSAILLHLIQAGTGSLCNLN